MKASDRVTKRVLATLFCLTALGIIAPPSGVMAQNPAPNVLHESQIIQPEGLEEGADFGFAIALGSEWLFVGEPGRFSDYGGVKNFRLTEGEWVANPWNFDPDDRNAFSLARYGQAIALAEQEDGAFFLTIGQARSFSALFGSSAARATSFFYDGTNRSYIYNIYHKLHKKIQQFRYHLLPFCVAVWFCVFPNYLSYS